VIHHIDLTAVLRRTVCEVYSDLVTRPTGAAVRAHIEQQLAALTGRTLTVIDFSNVGLLDLSCADEVVAKLLLRNIAAEGRDAYFVVRGVNEDHLDALEAVLERHGLALVVVLDKGDARLVGRVDEAERAAWEQLLRLGRATLDDAARVLGSGRPEAERVLEGLAERRLLMRVDDGWVAVGAAA
jgi:hypothetical protein